MHEASSVAIRRVRIIGGLEGVSYLLLLGVAMPLKYLAGVPIAVKITGWAHGALFVSLAGFVLVALMTKSLTWRHAVMVGVASLLPLGPFVIDRHLAGLERDA